MTREAILSHSVSSDPEIPDAQPSPGTWGGRSSRWTWLAAGLALIGIVVVAHSLQLHMDRIQMQAAHSGPVSRQVLMIAEDQVRATKPGPTLGALDYAYVAGLYADVLHTGHRADALAASRFMLQALFPDRTARVDTQIAEIAGVNDMRIAVDRQGMSPSSATVLDRYLDRYQHDGHTLAWDGKIPTGPDKWKSSHGNKPFSPRSGDWKRWVVNHPISLPPPPVYGSSEDARQLGIVRQAVSRRNGEDINIINFWAGQPGSETPAGIWQNVMFDGVQHDISPDATAADTQYAQLQKTLAETISDAFMECWKVKYTYWTARPDMRIPGLSTAMDDPSFPGYVSGHATTSKAAADVLSVIAPRYTATWQHDADQARYSRLVAGIHFDIDNAVGFKLGSAVAQQYVDGLQLKPEL